jgi:hypothetical protein
MNDKNHVPLTNQTKSEGAATLACYPLFTPLLRDECLPRRGKCSTKDVARIFEVTTRGEESRTWLRGPMQSLLSQKTTQQGNVSADRNLYPAMHKDTKAPSTNPTERGRADVWTSRPLWWALLRDEGLPFVAKFRPTNSRTRLRHPLPSGKGFDLLRATTFQESIHAQGNTHHHPDRSGWPRTVI